MTRKKLTLSVEERAIEKARRYSEQHNTSISSLVSRFLDRLPSEDGEVSPIVQRLMGILPSSTDEAEYDRHLEEKYGR